MTVVYMRINDNIHLSQLSQVLFLRTDYTRPLVLGQRLANREIGCSDVNNCLVLMHQRFVAENLR